MSIPDFPPMTDAQSIRFMLMLPWTMGDNSEDGSVSYDAAEIESILRFVDKLDAKEKERANRAETVLHEVLYHLEHAPISYANGVMHDGFDEGEVRGGEIHDALVGKIKKVLGEV